MHYHGNSVIQGFPALRKAVTTHLKKYVIFYTCVDIANQLLTRRLPLAPLGQVYEWTASFNAFFHLESQRQRTLRLLFEDCRFIYFHSLMKSAFFSVKGSCVYMINKIIHDCLKIWNFSSRVQLDISLVRCVHSWAIELHTEIPYLRAPMYYSLFIWWKITITRKKDYWAKISQPFGLQKL